MNLNRLERKYKPYRKPGNILYISIDSDHSAVVTKHLYKSITCRLSTNYKNKDIFERAKSVCKEALSKNGDEDKFSKQQQNKKNKGRNIIGFNPTYSKSVKNNIGVFLKLIRNNFAALERLGRVRSLGINVRCFLLSFVF